ncbi:DUF6482 family protein [Pokkaliibacter sp. CJK22405]|uniref:DUF6482 family protein n=1 Tax=Pokkaliibacter sp. CJK22405 TaxID=3384615 RepID=UPI00398477F1
MISLTIDQCRLQADRPEKLRVQSLENSLYLVEVWLGNDWARLVDEKGATCCFRSQTDAKRPFRGMGVREVVLRQQSAYDEMVGLPTGEDLWMEIPLRCPDEDI